MRPLPLLLLAACSDDRSEDSAGEAGYAPIACEAGWSDVGGIQVDPATCLGWSTRSAATMTWHAAVSAEETTSPDEDDDAWCADLTEGGRDDWRLPDAATLERLSTSSPPFEELDGHLWSRSSDSVDSLAWTVELSNPGLSLLLEKDAEAYVRCVVGE